MNTYSKRHFNRLPEACIKALQDWVGEKINLKEAVLHVHNGEDAVIVVAFIGYSINFYRLFAIGGEWVISVDGSVTLEDLQKATYNNYEEDKEDW